MTMKSTRPRRFGFGAKIRFSERRIVFIVTRLAACTAVRPASQSCPEVPGRPLDRRARRPYCACAWPNTDQFPLIGPLKILVVENVEGSRFGAAVTASRQAAKAPGAIAALGAGGNAICALAEAVPVTGL